MRYWFKFTSGEWREITASAYIDTHLSLHFWLERDGRVPKWLDGVEIAALPDDQNPGVSDTSVQNS
jgi:hypothetical protein